MAKYNYSRYNIKEEFSTNPDTWNWVYFGWGNANYNTLAITFGFDSLTNKFVFSNWNAVDNAYPNPPGTVRYATYDGGVTARKFILRQDQVIWDWYDIGASGVTKIKSQGAFIVNTVAEDGTYPTNGAHTDGYWYIKGTIVNTAPTAPSAFTSPSGVLEIGDIKSITWGPSTDTEGGDIQYELGVSINGGTFNILTTSTARSFNYTIPTTTSLQFRVRAKDDTDLYSAYTTSSSLTVSKPIYYWSKYNLSNTWNEPPEVPEYYSETVFAGKYKTATWNPANKTYTLSNPWPSDVTVSVGDIAYDSWSGLGIVKYVSKSLWASYNLIKTTSTRYEYVSSTSVEIKGTLAQSNVQAIEDTYPLDGKHTDGFWYIRGSRVNLSIASTGRFTTPVVGNILLPNKDITITFEHSSATSISLYEVDYRYGTSSWVPLAYNNTNTRNLTISNNVTDTELELRVRAKNTSNVYSAYVYSTIFTIKHNTVPTKPNLVVSSLNSKFSGEKVTLSASNLVNIDGDILTYTFEFYDGKAWQEIASNISEYKEITHTIPKIFGGINNAKYRVRAYDKEFYSDYTESVDFTINAGPSDVIAIDKTVVNKAYNTIGNGGRKLVRLNNGWLVAAVVGTEMYNPIYFFVDKQDGNGFTQLCFLIPNKETIGDNLSLVSNGNYIYAIMQFSDGTFSSPYSVEINVLTQLNVDISASAKRISEERSITGTSLAINEAGTELHAVWAGMVNSQLMLSNNIRYVKGIINTDGSVTWGTVEQITSWDSVDQYTHQPSIICKGSDAYIVTSVQYSNQHIVIYSKTFSSQALIKTNASWGNVIVFANSSPSQSNPSVVYVPKKVNGLANGRIWITWSGRDNLESTHFNIRVSYSDDNGKTWSPMEKLTSGITYNQIRPSITANANNEIFIIWSGSDSTDINNDIRQIKNVNGNWSTISTISSGTTYHKVDPSTLADTTLSFTKPVFIYKDSARVGFYGSYVNNQKPSTPVLLNAPSDEVNYGDIITLSANGSIDYENDNLTYFYEFYDGNEWIEFATNKLANEVVSHTIPYIFGTIVDAKYRVRVFDGLDYSNYAESGNFTINNLPSDILREDVLVTNRTNGINDAKRKLVKLSNGWLVFCDMLYRDGFNALDFYVSKNNGLTFELLLGINDNNYTNETKYNYSIVNKGTNVYVVISPLSPLAYGSVYVYYFDANSIKNLGKTFHLALSQTVVTHTETQHGDTIKVTRIQKSDSENSLSNVSMTINKNELHVAWVSKNALYPNTWNVRYAKGIISLNEEITWNVVEQVTKSTNSGYNFDNPSIIVTNNIPIIAVDNTGWLWTSSQGSSADTKGIVVFKRDNSLTTGTLGTGWTAKTIYSVHNHIQTTPSMVYVPKEISGLENGRIYVAWQGMDSVNITNNHIRLSYSDDLGVTWSTMQKLTTGPNTLDASSKPSIAVNKDNKVFITYDNYGIKQLSSNDGNVWQSKTIINNANYSSPSVLNNNDFIEPLFAVKDHVNSKIYFYGSWIDNRNPSIPKLNTTSLTTKNKKDKVILSASGSYNIEGNDMFYFFEFYDGKKWVEIASYKSENEKVTHAIPHIFGGTTEARYRVKAFGGKTFSGYATSNKFDINSGPSDIIVNDATIVNQLYDINGGSGRKLIRLNNGWLATILKTTNDIYIYISRNNGDTWQSLYQIIGLTSLKDAAITTDGKSIFLLYSANNSSNNSVHFGKINAETGVEESNKIIVPNSIFVGKVAFTINKDKNELHAAWQSTVSAFPNSINILYAKGIIDTNGTITWGTVEQITYWNNIDRGMDIHSIFIRENIPNILFSTSNISLADISQVTGSSIGIFKNDKSLTVHSSVNYNWSFKNIYYHENPSYRPYLPSTIYVPKEINGLENGRIWVVWHGADSIDTYHQIRVSYSDDDGKTWSAMKKLTNTLERSNSNASITFNKNNEIFIVWQGNKDVANNSDNRIKQIKNVDGVWGTINEIKTSPQSDNPSALIDTSIDIVEPLFIYKDVTNSKIRFSGSWLNNKKPSNPILNGIPTVSKNHNEQVVLSASGSVDFENDNLTYSFEFYNGKEWAVIADNVIENKEITHIIPHIIGGVSNAKYRVRVFDGLLYSDYITSTNFTINPRPSDVIAIDKTVVDKSYTVGTTNSRRLVRLSNGWIVAAAISTEMYNPVYFYVDRMDGNGFTRLCSYRISGNSASFLSIVSFDTKIYFLVNNDSSIDFVSFDAATQADVNLTKERTHVTSSLSSLSLAINKTGTELHAAWSCKDTLIPQTFNVHYADAKIKSSVVNWNNFQSVTKYQATSITFAKDVSIIITDENIPVILFASPDTVVTGTIGSGGAFGGSAVPRSLYIVKRSSDLMSNSTVLNPSWTINKIVDNQQSYSYSSPSMTYVSKEINGLENGRIWVTWHGKTAEEPNYDNVFISYSDDFGRTWSKAERLQSE